MICKVRASVLAIMLAAGVHAPAQAGSILNLNLGASPNDNTGDSLRVAGGKLNAAVNGIGSCFNGPTAPSSMMTYQCWFDTSTAPTTLRYLDGTVWVAAGLLNTSAHSFSPVGVVGGDLSGTLPNPTVGLLAITNAKMAAGAAAANVGTLGGALTGTLPNPTLAAGVAATNIGTVSGDLSGTLPAPTVARIQGTLVTGTTGTGKIVFAASPTMDSASVTTGLNVAYTNTILPGARGLVFIWSNCSSATLAGQNCGFQAWTGNNPTGTPGAGSPTTGTIVMVNGNNRGAGPAQIEGLNVVAVLCGPAETPGCTVGAGYLDTSIIGVEADLSTSSSFSTRNRAFNSTSGSFNKIAYEAQNSPGVAQLTAAYTTWGANANLGATFYEGVALASISDIGVHFIANPLTRTDTFTAFSVCALCDDSNSASFAKFGNFTHTGAMIDISAGATFTGGFYKGLITADSDVLFKNAADFNMFIDIDSGSSASRQSFINYFDKGTIRWQAGKQSDNTFVIFSTASGHSSMVVAANDATTFKSTLTFGSAALPNTTVSFTNDAASATATLTNSPSSGNPKKWIPINDNGTALDIPAWCHTSGC